LHEEFHALYNGVAPYAPSDAAGMDDEDEDEPAASPGDDGDVFDLDDSPEE
jgi:hypothetical protein